MARTPGFALLGVLLFAAACGAERGQDVAVVLGTATAAPSTVPTRATVEPNALSSELTATATPAPSPTAESDGRSAGVAAPLATQFTVAAALIEGASSRTGVAVVTSDAKRYVGGDQSTFALASVAKLPVMLATLERARIEARPLTTQEEGLLALMITASNNNATDSLWQSLGQGAGVAQILEPIGLADLEYAIDHQWGDSRATALQIASLLKLLVAEDSPLTLAVREQALTLMRAVQPDQRWGAAAGVDSSGDTGVLIAIKNGWYPEPEGWLLNSVGIVSLEGMSGLSAAHIVVVLTEGAPTQTEGVRQIERVAAAINHELVPPTLSVVPQSPTFVAAPLPPAGSNDPDGPVPDPEAATTSEPEPPPTVELTAYANGDVLVPADGLLIGTEGTSSELTLWYKLPAASADLMLGSYATSMLQFGWLELSGPPSVVLSKSGEGRWVGLATFPAAQGARLVEVTISPAPGVVPAAATAP